MVAAQPSGPAAPSRRPAGHGRAVERGAAGPRPPGRARPGAKNAAELSPAARAAGFDFAIAEECQAYSECSSYTDVYGTERIEIEYSDQNREFFTAACASRGGQVSVVRRDRGVTPAGEKAHVEEWC